MKKLHNHGFTIIELLIATVSFSLILLIITGAIIQFSKLYYRGVVTSKTQEVARTVSEDIARSIQFSSTKPTTGAAGPGYNALCVGNRRYNFILNKQLTDVTPHAAVEAFHVLTVDTPSGGCSATSPYNGDVTGVVGNNATEMLGDKMQLLDLSVTEAPIGSGIITVMVTVAYGGDVNLATKQCPAINFGGQFCAVSTIKTTVTKRL